MSEKSSTEQANEQGQKDGSTGGGYAYEGWLYQGKDLDAYNAGHKNGSENPAPSDDDNDW